MREISRGQVVPAEALRNAGALDGPGTNGARAGAVRSGGAVEAEQVSLLLD